MTSQLDLDQGGTNREWNRIYLGPSVGWVAVPYRNQLSITLAGFYTLDLSTNYVAIAVAGVVNITLPPTLITDLVAGVQPARFVRAPVSFIDTGGFAAANPITILPAVGETIMGLASVQITSNFGGFILHPNNAGKWTNQS